ncbi:hypothetical protein [Rhizobium grahamii]|uniref:hypothetical protein n=1 Tax=Rhizobium grahamii TaxID=1120045 RepID=UPI000E0B48E5|nr:hypothetical protein [Rhizobium grahamii]
MNRSVKDGSATANQVASSNSRLCRDCDAAPGHPSPSFSVYAGRASVPPEWPAILSLAAKVTHLLLYVLHFAPSTGVATYYLGYGTHGGIHAGVLKVVSWD